MKDKGEYLETLIGLHDDFKGTKFILGSPEYESKFDRCRGYGRYHDLLVLGKDNKGDIIISVESKVDEGFGGSN